ncbi:hypothetical protein [Brevundimonas aveniformis]|uniref:hypothetical protein n=1 Tax=Brevundimonas aveniformis TaxID=370977 RepID=UPI000422242F|nr:hypothetical protein [Brevundimonas aveniformis]
MRDAIKWAMRTTLTIDDDVLAAARAMAEAENKSLGQIVSELARRSLRGPTKAATRRNGLTILPSRGGKKVTLELVNQIRDDVE